MQLLYEPEFYPRQTTPSLIKFTFCQVTHRHSDVRNPAFRGVFLEYCLTTALQMVIDDPIYSGYLPRFLDPQVNHSLVEAPETINLDLKWLDLSG